MTRDGTALRCVRSWVAALPLWLALAALLCFAPRAKAEAGTDAADGTPGSAATTPQRNDIASVLSSTVIFLFNKDPKDGGLPIGTAFVVGYPVPGGKPGEVVPLVVTAKHIATALPRLVGRFNGKPGKDSIVITYDRAALQQAGDYWEYPDPNKHVDLAVFRTPHSPDADYQCLPLDLVPHRQQFADEDVKAMDRVVFPSLLVTFADTPRNYPVVRDGSIALIPGEPLLLINATSIGGVSGAPLFLWPGPRLRNGAFDIGGTRPLLIGVMNRVWGGDRVFLRIQPDGTQVPQRENSGIAEACPSWLLREILDQEAIRKRVLELTSTHQ